MEGVLRDVRLVELSRVRGGNVGSIGEQKAEAATGAASAFLLG